MKKLLVVLVISVIFVFGLSGLSSAESWCNPEEGPNEDGVRVCKYVEPNMIDICDSSNEISITLKVTWPVEFGYVPADIVFTIDSSESMVFIPTDKEGKRIKESTRFVEMMEEEPKGIYRATVVSWDDDIDFICPCENNFLPCKSPEDAELADDLGKVKECLQKIDSEGAATDYDPALNASIEILIKKGRPKANRIIIFLTDAGIDSYDKSLIEKAKNNNIKIYTIGLSVSPPWDSTLRQIATGTGGKYYPAPTSDALKEIFSEIALETIIDTPITSIRVTDVLHNYLEVKDDMGSENYPNVKGPTTNPDGTTTMKWKVNDLKAGHWEKSFNATFELSLPVDVVDGSKTLRETSEVVYGIRSEKTVKTVTIPIPEGEVLIECSPQPTTTRIPGFEAIFAIAGLLAVAYLIWRRKK